MPPDLAALLAQPNPLSDQFHFRENQILDLLLVGNNIVAKDEYQGGLPTALYRLRPDRVRILFNGFGTERTLSYALLETTGGGSSVQAQYDVDEIIHWRTANPRDPIWGMGYIEAGEVAFATNRALNETLRAYFDRGAILDGVIILPQEELSDVEYNRLISRWRSMRQRGRAQIKTGVLTGGAQYKAVQEPLGNLPVVQLKQMARNEVLELFGVPPAKLGDFQGSNWRNAQEADTFFYSETIAPLVKRTEFGWTSLVALWNPKWHVRFRVPDLSTDFASRADAASKLAMTDSVRRNEIREKAGLPPLDPKDPRGDEIVNTSVAARGALPSFGGQNDPTPTSPQSLQDIQSSANTSTMEMSDS